MFLRNYFTPYQNNVTSMVVCHQVRYTAISAHGIPYAGFCAFLLSKYRLLEVQHWWFINNGPCETFSMLGMRSIRLALVVLCYDVLLSVAIFLFGS